MSLRSKIFGALLLLALLGGGYFLRKPVENTP